LVPKLAEQIKCTLQNIISVDTNTPLQQIAVILPAEVKHSTLSVVESKIPPTPIYHWFFNLRLQNPHHFNQAQMIKIAKHYSPKDIKMITRELLKHHDILRLQLNSPENEKFELDITGVPSDIPFEHRTLTNVSKLQEEATIINSSLNISKGPILKVVLFEIPEKDMNQLLIVIHHLSVDGVSWRIILEDVNNLLEQIHKHEPIQLQPKTSSFKQWATQLHHYSNTPNATQELSFWTSVLSNCSHAPTFEHILTPQDTVSTVSSVIVSLNREETDQLASVCKVFHSQINEVLLTCFAISLISWRGGNCVAFSLEGHGREELFEQVDISQTVGWFTSMFPVYLSLQGIDTTKDITSSLKSIKEQLRQIPNKGIGFGILKHLNHETSSKLNIKTPADMISFNFLGRFSQSTEDDTSVGQLSCSTNQLYRLLDVNGMIKDSKLVSEWTFPQRLFTTDQLQRVADIYLETLQKLIVASKNNP